MSMTREEAAKWLEETIQDTDTYFSSCSQALQKELDEQKEVFLLALSALRPVSREMVERVWPGCEACKDASLAIGEIQLYWTFEGSIDVSGNMHYCPNCGRPITPVAKERQVERLEALKDGKDCSI